MGVLQGLFEGLGIRPEGPPGVGLSSPGITESVMGFPAIPRSGLMGPTETMPGEIAGMPVPPTGGLPPILSPTDVAPGANEGFASVEGWAPTKRNLIGRLADAFLLSQGKKPVYEPRMVERDMKRAMKGYMQNPEESIRRMMEIDPEVGMKLYNQYVDNKRGDEVQQRLRMLQEEKYRDNIAAMLGAANENNYGAMLPRIRQYAQNRGIDTSELPDTYDPDAIQMWRMSGMTVDQQLDNDRQDANTESQINYRSTRLGQQASEVASRNANRSDQIADRNERTDEYVRRGREGGGRGGAKGSTKTRKQTFANRVFKGPNGSLVEYDKHGTGVKVTHPSGKIFWYKIDLNGKPIKVGEE